MAVRRWTLKRNGPMTTSLDGPKLALGESVEVIEYQEDLEAKVKRYQDEIAYLRRVEAAATAVVERRWLHDHFTTVDHLKEVLDEG